MNFLVLANEEYTKERKEFLTKAIDEVFSHALEEQQKYSRNSDWYEAYRHILRLLNEAKKEVE